jgi:CRP-like cAMP-binding protein
MQSVKRTFAKDTLIFEEGERGQHMYIVRSGRVLITRRLKGEDKKLAELREGAIFGELALLDGGSRMASAKALTDCVCEEISIDNVRKRMLSMDPFDRALVRVLLQTIRHTLRIYEDVVENDRP